MKKFLFIFVFLITIVNLIQAGEIEKFPDFQIKINNEKINLDSTIIKLNEQFFFPIRDLLSYFDGSFVYNRRDNLYRFNLGKHSANLVILPNSQEFYLNNRQQYFSEPAFEEGGQLYIPIKEFFQSLGYQVEISNNLAIITYNEKNSKNIKNIDKKSIFSETKDNERLIDLNSKLPRFESDREQYLDFGTKKLYLINDFYYSKDKILYLNFSDVFKAEGYQTDIVDDNVLIKYKGRSVLFSTKTNTAEITDNNLYSEKQFFYTIAPVQINKTTIYVPLISFFQAFEKSFQWSSKKRELAILSEIAKVQIRNDDKAMELQFLILDKKKIQVSKNKEQKKIVLEVPYAVSLFSSDSLDINKENIAGISFNNYENKTYIDINLIKNLNYELKEKDGRFFLILKPVVEVSFEKNENALYFRSDAEINYTNRKYPKKILLDFYNSNLKIDDDVKNKQSNFNFVISDQSPEISRLIIECKNENTYQFINKSKNEIKILFKEINKEQIKQRETIISAVEDPIIVIDPGHGGADPGAMNGEIKEKDLNLEISLALKAELEKQNVKVLLTRDIDKDMTLQERVYFANNSSAKLLLSVHFNSHVNNYANGTETYYFKPDEKRLADIIHEELVAKLGLRNNGVRKARFYINRFSNIPSVTIEPLYLSNQNDFNNLKNAEFKNKTVIALKEAVLKYLKE